MLEGLGKQRSMCASELGSRLGWFGSKQINVGTSICITFRCMRKPVY